MISVLDGVDESVWTGLVRVALDIVFFVVTLSFVAELVLFGLGIVWGGSS